MEFSTLRNSIEDFDCKESNADYQWRNFSPEEIAARDYAAAKDVLRKQTHEYDIVPRDFVEVCIDLAQQGVAGYDSWGAKTDPQYRIPAEKDYNWSFTLIPIADLSEIVKKNEYKY